MELDLLNQLRSLVPEVVPARLDGVLPGEGHPVKGEGAALYEDADFDRCPEMRAALQDHEVRQYLTSLSPTDAYCAQSVRMLPLEAIVAEVEQWERDLWAEGLPPPADPSLGQTLRHNGWLIVGRTSLGGYVCFDFDASPPADRPRVVHFDLDDLATHVTAQDLAQSFDAPGALRPKLASIAHAVAPTVAVFLRTLLDPTFEGSPGYQAVVGALAQAA